MLAVLPHAKAVANRLRANGALSIASNHGCWFLKHRWPAEILLLDLSASSRGHLVEISVLRQLRTLGELLAHAQVR